MDSSIYESAPKSKVFLDETNWISPFEAFRTDVDELILKRKIYTPKFLISNLSSALECLNTFPGLNLEFRREHSRSWILWWINFLKTLPDTEGNLQETNNIYDFDNIVNLTQDNGRNFGIFFAGGLSGHLGHRFAVDQVLQDVRFTPIIMLEQDSYALAKGRVLPFLPLDIKLSMWSHYIENMFPYKEAYLTVNPFSGWAREDVNRLEERGYEVFCASEILSSMGRDLKVKAVFQDSFMINSVVFYGVEDDPEIIELQTILTPSTSELTKI